MNDLLIWLFCYSETVCSFARHFTMLSRNAGILIGSLLRASCYSNFNLLPTITENVLRNSWRDYLQTFNDRKCCEVNWKLFVLSQRCLHRPKTKLTRTKFRTVRGLKINSTPRFLGIKRQICFAGCRLKFNYKWKTAGAKNNLWPLYSSGTLT